VHVAVAHCNGTAREIAGGRCRSAQHYWHFERISELSSRERRILVGEGRYYSGEYRLVRLKPDTTNHRIAAGSAEAGRYNLRTYGPARPDPMTVASYVSSGAGAR
jgi:hypothetical protein